MRRMASHVPLAFRFVSFVITAIIVALLPTQALTDNPRVVVAQTGNDNPEAVEVVKILKQHLIDTDIDIEVHTTDANPTTTRQWLEEASKAMRQKPGVIILIGYSCGETNCTLFAVEPTSSGVTAIQVEIPEHSDLTTAYALAATAREVFLGPLVPELERLARHGANPSPPPPSPDSIWLRPPLEEARKAKQTDQRPWLWLEGGYAGDHPHPDGKPNHGLYLGAALEPRPFIGLFVSVGWLGIRHRTVTPWEARLHRLTSSLALRVMFSLGPAEVSIAPVVRFDTVFSEIENQDSGVSFNDTDLEIQAGGITTWHLPLSRRLEAVVGAGLLFSVLASDFEAESVLVLPASDIRFIWTAGLAWSPL